MALPRPNYSHPGYKWEDLSEQQRRKGVRACRELLAALVKVSGKRTLGEAKTAYQAKNELDL